MWLDLDFKGQVGGQLLQVESRVDQTVKAQPGFSGTPAFDAGAATAIGLLQSAPLPDEPERDAYLLSASEIAQTWAEPFDYLLAPSNPYRGLEPFTATDTSVFFGRDNEIGELRDRVGRQPVVIVVGPSGVGKSSLVQSGLLPALTRAQPWSVAVFRPGKDPWLRLAAALLRAERGAQAQINGDDIRREEDRLRSEGLGRTFELLRSQDRPLVIVIDQFEELLDEKSHDAALLNMLLPAPDAVEEAGRIIITLRASFQPALQSIPGFHIRLNERLYLLSPLTEAQMRDVVERPAATREVKFEHGLVNRIVKDATGGSLPVLEFTLTQLWGRQRQKTITFSAYEQMGGVSGALNRFADQKAAELSDTAADVLDRVLLKLVSRSRAGAQLATRQRVLQSESTSVEWDVLSRLSNARLVNTGTDPRGENPYAELAHETLIVAWDRLRALIDENADFLRWLGGIQERLADGDPLPEPRIAESRRWIEARPESVPQVVREFVKASETAVEMRMRELHEAREAAKTEAVSRRVAINVGLVPLIRSVASGADAQTVLRLVVNTAAGLIGDPQHATRVYYFELEAAPLRLVPKHHAVRPGGDTQRQLMRGAPDGIADLVEKMVRNETVFVADVDQSGGPMRATTDYKSFIAVPVAAGDIAYGMLSVDTRQPHGLDPGDVDLLNAMAGLIAIAMRSEGGPTDAASGAK